MWLLRYIVLCVIAYVVVCQNEERERIEEFINDVLLEHNVPGMIVAIVKDGEAYLADGYGVADIVDQTPVTDDTLMYTASTGKAFTSALVAKILEEFSDYDLDTPVRTILGEEFEIFDGYRRFHVTVRDLLSHRVCIPTATVQFMLGAIEDRDDLLYRSRFFNPVLEFRSELQYDNVWYTWAGRVAERLMGQQFEDIMHQYILQPLGMDDTEYISQLSEEGYARMATPYYIDYISGEGLREVTWDAYSCAGAENPSGGMVSNAKDLIKWLLFQTSRGKNQDGDEVLDEDLWRQTIKPNVPGWGVADGSIKPDRVVTYTEDNYGLGWFTGYYRGYPIHAHSGALWGFWSRAIVMPDMGIALYQVANGPIGGQAGAAQKKIEQFTMDLFLGLEPWLNATTPVAEEPVNYEPMEARFAAQTKLMEETYGAETIHKLVSDHQKLLESDESSNTRNKRQASDRSKYAGTYGTYCCGNVTVSHNALLDTLSATYGDCGNINLVELNEEEHIFLMVFREPMWFFPPVETLQFFSPDGGLTIDSMVVRFMLPQDPPILYRDLDMETQPDMPPDCQ